MTLRKTLWYSLAALLTTVTHLISFGLRRRNNRKMARIRLLDFTLLVLCLLAGFLVLIGCEQTDPPEPDKNREPETAITIGPVEGGETYYRVHLFWKGFDEDGLISGFQYAIGDTSRQNARWQFTTKTDSEFVFPTATDLDQSQVANHIFNIRAIDNEGKEDRTPSIVDFRAITTVEPRSIISTFPEPLTLTRACTREMSA